MIMIDYEKLKQAHELSLSSEEYWISAHFGIDEHGDYEIYDTNNNAISSFHNEEELLTKLIELTQPQLKYKVGQTVAYIDEENFPKEFIIEDVCEFCIPSYWESKENDIWHLEEELYQTKQSLIEAQIEHWQSMLEPKLRTIKSTPCKGNIPVEKIQRAVDSMKKIKQCVHEYQKTLDKSGMYFINMCHKCHNRTSWSHPGLEKILINCVHWHDPNMYTSEGKKIKCRHCGEYYEPESNK